MIRVLVASVVLAWAAAASAKVEQQRFPSDACQATACRRASIVEAAKAMKGEFLAWQIGERMVVESGLDTLSYLATRFIERMIREEQYRHARWSFVSETEAGGDPPDVRRMAGGMWSCRQAVITLKFMLLDISRETWPKPFERKLYKEDAAACRRWIATGQ